MQCVAWNRSAVFSEHFHSYPDGPVDASPSGTPRNSTSQVHPPRGDEPLVQGSPPNQQGPTTPPWDFLPQKDGNETFIHRDGQTLIALETVARLYHPSLLLEAESYSSASGTPTVDGNNSPGFLNGGQSVFFLGGGDWLCYSFLPPAPDGGDYEYTILLRLANDSGGSQPVQVEVDPGGPGAWVTTASVPSTQNQYDYEIVTVGPVLLTGGVSHTVKVVFEGPSYAFDSLVVKSRGVAQ